MDNNENNDKHLKAQLITSVASDSSKVDSEIEPSNFFTSHLLAVLCIICLLLVTSWLWVEMSERFPNLPYGSYYGKIEGVFLEESGKPIDFYVESLPSDELFFAVIRKGWRQLPISAVRDSQSSSMDWIYPIVIHGPGARLKFVGSFDEEKGYSGQVKELGTGKKGTWHLSKVMEGKKENDGLLNMNLDLWLRLKSELEEIQVQIAQAEKKSPQQKEEVDKLTKFVTDKDKAKLMAEQEFSKRQQELAALKKELLQKMQEAKNLNQQVSIALRVTPMGKLVSLARETLERENRWIESMLKSSVMDTDNELELAIEQAEKIMEVKREIAIERDRIYMLEGKTGERGNVRIGEPSFQSHWKRNRRY